MKTDRIVFAFLSDTHFNHSLGLLAPGTLLPTDPTTIGDDGKPIQHSYALTPVQHWLWGNFISDVNNLRSFVGKDRLFVIIAGDVCQGNKHRDELVSQRESDQILMAAYGLKPIMDLPQLEAMYIVKGTDAHDMLAGSLATLVAEQLRLTYPKKPVEVLYHPVLNVVDKFKIDVSHHGPHYGSRAWLKGNELGWYLRDILMTSLMNGETPPDILVRGHVHDYALNIQTVITKESGSHLCVGMILPPYSVATSFARKVAKSPQHSTTGMIAMELWTSGVINYKPKEWLHFLPLTREFNIK